MPINTDIVLERFQAGFNIRTRSRNQCSRLGEKEGTRTDPDLPIGFDIRRNLESGSGFDAIFLGGALLEL